MLDRLDRLVLAGSAPRAGSAASTPAASSSVLAGVPARPAVPRVTATPPFFTSKRGPRFVDHTPCPMCTSARVGVEYHGELMDGTKVHQLYAHSPDRPNVRRGELRCMGAGLRLVFVGGTWKGAQP